MTELVFYEDGGFHFHGTKLDFRNYKKKGNIYYLAIESYRAKMLFEDEELIFDLETDDESERAANAAKNEAIAQDYILYTISYDEAVQDLEAGYDALGYSPEYILVLRTKDFDYLKAQSKLKKRSNPAFAKSGQILDYMKLHFYGYNTV
ncbi:hypothetical protein GGI21_001757 [Coemansia aciculifera]|nr:hypothetical protein GGI21_001757 [Coemansia aciculifera]